MIIRVCRERAQMDRNWYWFGLAGWRRLPGWDGKGEQADMSSWVFGMNDIIVKTINSHFNSFIWRKYRNKLCTEEGYPLKVIYFSFNLFFIIHSIHTIWILWITLAWMNGSLLVWLNENKKNYFVKLFYVIISVSEINGQLMIYAIFS